MSKSQQIIQAKKANPNATAAEIASMLGVNRTLVYSALSYHAKKSGKVAKRGRPRKFVTPVIEVDINQPSPFEVTTRNVMSMQVESLEDEVKQLKAVIRYLEGKVYGASV